MSKIKNKIRQDISQLVDVLIPENRWTQYIDLLDRDGIPNRKQLIGIFMIMAQHIEVIENIIDDEKLGKSFDKLRSASDVNSELEAQQDSSTKAFYVSSSDFGVLEKSINLSLAKLKPEYGYGKETDPRDGKEKTCLYFKDLPVFKE